MAGIDEKEHAFQLAASLEVIADQPRPALDLSFRSPRVAVSWHIDEIERAVLAEHEEIELARPSRRHRDPGEAGAPGQRVDEARLADIGAAGEGHFGAAVARQVGDARHALEEGARGLEQRLASGEIGLGEIGALQRVTPGLDPGAHSVTSVPSEDITEWMPASSAGMTD